MKREIVKTKQTNKQKQLAMIGEAHYKIFETVKSVCALGNTKVLSSSIYVTETVTFYSQVVNSELI